MDSLNFEKFRHFIRETERVPSQESSKQYTFSSCDINEFETYIKEISFRRSMLSIPRFFFVGKYKLIF